MARYEIYLPGFDVEDPDTWDDCREFKHCTLAEVQKYCDERKLSFNEVNDDFSESDALELERDFCTAMNMMLGESHEQAQESAKQWMNEARE